MTSPEVGSSVGRSSVQATEISPQDLSQLAVLAYASKHDRSPKRKHYTKILKQVDLTVSGRLARDVVKVIAGRQVSNLAAKNVADSIRGWAAR